jgi:hypothetical protein
MSETKRMHYVPQTYLKHFAKEVIKGSEREYFIDCLTKDKNDEIKSINIKNVCLENDIYTLPGETTEQRLYLENMYRKLYEDDYDKLYTLLTNKNIEKVTPAQRYEIIAFVVSMFYRNNSWKNSHNKLMDETYSKVFSLARDNGQESFFMEEQEISIAGKTLEAFQKESRKEDRPMIALIQAQKIFQLIRIRLRNDVVTVVNIQNDSFDFVTSDNPVSCQGEPSQWTMPFDPNNTLSIPIDNKNLLQLRPWANQLDRNMLGRMSESSIVAMASTLINNNFQFNQAERFVLGNETGLKRFLEQKEKYK